MISGVSGRYARSLFELAREEGAVEKVESELSSFDAMLAESADLTRLVESPVFSADQQLRAISAILDKAGLSGLTSNFLRVVAQNRRLFAVPGMIAAYRRIAAEARG
jgi:F-type H+-transporting ATPase subunit delta